MPTPDKNVPTQRDEANDIAFADPTGLTPALLAWARTSAHLTIGDIAALCAATPGDVESWEDGFAEPSIAQLRLIARKCHRPIAAFFLREAPGLANVPPEFRSFAPNGLEAISADTVFAIRAATRLREIVLDLPNEMTGNLPDFTAWAQRLSSDPDRAGRMFRETSGISVETQVGWKSNYDALKQWRRIVEAEFVLVLQFRFPIDDARGFSIYSPNYPIVVLNTGDAPTARSFTLFHEIAHLALGHSGVFRNQVAWEAARDGSSPADLALAASEHETEVFCNRFASAFLLPSGERYVERGLASCVRGASTVDEDVIAEFARAMKVSRFVILRKLEARGMLSYEKARALETKWKENVPPPAAKARGGARVTQAQKCVSQRGRTVTSIVLDALDSDVITSADLSDFLGVKLRHIDDIRRLLEA